MNYADLKTAIQDTTANYETTFVSHIDQFITMTEKRIIQEAQLPLEQNSATLVATIGSTNLDITALTTYMSVDSLALNIGGVYKYLDNKEEEYLRAAFPDITATGRPRLYCVYDTKTLKLAPTPDQAYSIELRYLSYPTGLVASPTGTWLSTNFEFALLYGALRDAAIYLKEEPDVVAMYENKYTEALNEVKLFGTARASVDSYRSRST
jgi:hypothetical protein